MIKADDFMRLKSNSTVWASLEEYVDHMQTRFGNGQLSQTNTQKLVDQE